MNEFVTWEMLGDVVKLTGIVLAVTQFVKNRKFVKKVDTQTLAWFIAFALITITNINLDKFAWMDLVLYALSALFISASASGIYIAGDKKSKTTSTVLTEKQQDTLKRVKDLSKEEKKDEKSV